MLGIAKATLAVVLLSIMVTPVAAFSVDSTTRTVFAEYWNPSNLPTNPLQDADSETFPGPPVASSISARVESRPDQLRDPNVLGRMGYASAAAGPLGLTDVSVAGVLTGSAFGQQFLEAEVTESIIATAPTPTGTYEVAFSFDLYNISFEFWDDFGLGGFPEQLHGNIFYSVFLVGSRTKNYEATVEVWNNAASYRVMPATGFVGHPWTETSDPAQNYLRIDLAPLSVSHLVLGTIDVDAAAPLETFEVRTLMRATLAIPDGAIDVGGRVAFNDPNGLAVNPTRQISLNLVTPGPQPGVPQPSVVWLLIAGLASRWLGWWLRRR